MSKITVDQKKCIACGTCYAIYPELFEAGDDGKSCVKDSDYKKYSYNKDEIIGACAMGAIAIED